MRCVLHGVRKDPMQRRRMHLPTYISRCAYLACLQTYSCLTALLFSPTMSRHASICIGNLPCLPFRRLAALEACSSCPLVDLRLEGAVPLSGAVAEAVEACCPQLARLTLDHQISSRPVREALRGEAASEYHYGCVQLLTLCGPRLRELRLRGVQCWQPMSYMALRRCTALVTLELEVGRKVVLGLRVEDERHGGECHALSLLVGRDGPAWRGPRKRWKAMLLSGIPVPVNRWCAAAWGRACHATCHATAACSLSMRARVPSARSNVAQGRYCCICRSCLCTPRCHPPACIVKESHAPRLGRYFVGYSICLVTALCTCASTTWPLPGAAADDPDVDARLFGQVSHLKTLQALHLVLDGDPNACTPDAVRPHATCVARLSALTGLTRLGLVLSSCYEHDGDSYRRHVEDGEQHGAWVEVREAHRTSLLSALRCMPQLLQLYCPTQWLRLSELPPSLTALTSLTLGGILPPPAEEGPGGLAGGGGLPARRAAGAPLPPQLRELVLKVGASPRALAQLQPPPSLVHLHMHALRFGISDVEDGKLRPEAVAAVGPAVRTLLACRHPTRGPSHIRISGDGGAGQLLPREGSPNGHMEWIQQLRGLQAIRNLTLVGVRLRPADLCCLGQALSSLQGKDAAHSVLLPAIAVAFTCLGFHSSHLRCGPVFLTLQSLLGVC